LEPLGFKSTASAHVKSSSLAKTVPVGSESKGPKKVQELEGKKQEDQGRQIGGRNGQISRHGK
jgi:hypothetical protein